MNKLIQIAAALVLFFALSPVSMAKNRHSDPANDRARVLIQRMKAAKPKKPLHAAAPLLNFSSAPSQGVQNQTLSWVVQFDNPFTNRELSIEVKNNGQKVTNVQSPYKGMFLVALGLQTEARALNTLEVTLFAEDPQAQADTRNAVKLLDTDVRRLTTQINAARDPALRAILQAQREEKIALKNELLAQLKKFRWKLGTQTQKYSVIADPDSATLPKISSISPVWGDVRGGTLVTISGMNFSENVSVLFGGLASPSVTYVNENTVQAVSPDFEAAVGGKDIELRFAQNGITRNVISANAFFAANVADAVPTKPVAIASGSLRLDLGETALLDGSLSYTANPSTLGYEWKVAAAPATSNFTTGQIIGTASTASVSPSAYGTYVFSLVVRDLDTADHLESEPSIVVLQVDGGPQPVASAITIASGGTATTQVVANDPTPGEAITYSIFEGPAHGSASISASGLVTYLAPTNFIGSDSLKIRVSDQAGHVAELSIPITVLGFSAAPAPFADGISTHSEPKSTQVHANAPDMNQTFTYEIVAGPSHGSASISSSGLLTYQPASGYVGQDSVAVRVADSGEPPLFGVAVVSITVSANSTPVVNAQNIILSLNTTSGTTQAFVQDDEGQTGSYALSDPAHGTAEVSTSGLVTYTTAGSFAGSDSFTLSYTDNGDPGLTGTKIVYVYTNDPPVASAPAINLTTGGTATSQISASDPNPGQSLGYFLSGAPAHGTAEVDASGLVTYHSTGGYTGSDSLMVTVFDNGMPQMSTPVEILVSVGANHAPSGSAPPIVVAGLGTGTSQIMASANDAGETLSYAISTQPENGTASVDAAGLVSFTSTSSSPSSSSIGVTITDSGFPNLSTTISIGANVTGPANQPPVIPDSGGANSLGFTLRTQGVPYQTTMGLGFGATETIHDPDGSVVSATWDFGDGTQEKTSDFSLGQITHNYMSTGTFTATLTIVDNGGASASRSIPVNVVNTDIPTAKFTVSPSNGGGGTLPITITFDASGSADSDGITQYRWRFGNNATSEVVTTNPVIQRTFTTAPPGNSVAVRLRTRDDNRAQGESVVNVAVGAASTGSPVQAQLLIGPPREVLLGAAMNFNGSRSFNPNVGGSIAAYNWNFGDFFTCPGASGGCTGSGLNASYTYPAVGNLNPSLRVQSGGGGLSVAAFQEVFVVNQGHAPRAIATASALSGVAPLTVNFSGGQSYDYDGAIASHQWFFGDGSTPVCNPVCDNQGANVSHTFTAPGTYMTRLNVFDSDNNLTGATLAITVNPSGAPAKRTRTVSFDPEREYQRQVLSGACFDGNGEACSNLADMYAEDGEAYTAANLKSKACELGFEPACSRKGGRK